MGEQQRAWGGLPDRRGLLPRRATRQGSHLSFPTTHRVTTFATSPSTCGSSLAGASGAPRLTAPRGRRRFTYKVGRGDWLASKGQSQPAWQRWKGRSYAQHLHATWGPCRQYVVLWTCDGECPGCDARRLPGHVTIATRCRSSTTPTTSTTPRFKPTRTSRSFPWSAIGWYAARTHVHSIRAARG